MEAVPRLPMISFDLKTSTEIASFGPKLKPYISSFYNEDSESYTNEIHSLETLRAASVRPSIDVSGVQLLKNYYCQLHFLRSRFPMEENQTCAVYFSWRDNYSNMVCSIPDIDFEMMNILYDIGALHSKLGSMDSRVTPDGMKMACTHFQCAAWAFQTVREQFAQSLNIVLVPEVIQFMHLTCLAQAQECILEKSMMDNRKATIIAKIGVQVVEYYKQALATLQGGGEEGSLSDLVGSRVYKEWVKYLNFKMAYHKAIALLYQGQQVEEQQKMGERVAFYQAASDQLQEACKKANNLGNQQEIAEALAFTGDVIEGKRKAAKNENEFIYHEDVPDKDALQEVKGATLVKGIGFNVNDVEVSGLDIFARLIPMEAHEASSLYSEQKAQMLRQLGELVESKDRALGEFMSSLQLDILTQMKTATGLTQDLVDRAAAMSARTTAIQDLVNAMAKLSNTYHDVESMLKEIDFMLKEEEKKEQEYQSLMGSRPLGIVATDLTREYTKYQEAHSKASDSNQNLHRAMTTHIANLKVLALPLAQLKQQIPSVEFPNSQIDEDVIREMEALVAKVEEMKNQRAMVWGHLRDAIQNDDITELVVTKKANKSLNDLFQEEMQKHQKQKSIIEQNMVAQENILKALVDVYARFTNTRRFLQEVVTKRATTISALVTSYDTYDDLLAKANKGFEFYNKLETNVTKLLQRIKSTCKVQDEEREQMLAKHNKSVPVAPAPPTTSILPSKPAPKLKDYLDSRNAELKRTDVAAVPNALNVYSAMSASNQLPEQVWPPAVRPAPVGSETNTDPVFHDSIEQNVNYYGTVGQAGQYINSAYATAATTLPNTITTYSNNYNYMYMHPYSEKNVNDDLNSRMAALMSKPAANQEGNQHSTYAYPAHNSNLPASNENVYYSQTATTELSPGYSSMVTSANGSGTQIPAQYANATYPYQANNYFMQSPQAAGSYHYNNAAQQHYSDSISYSSNTGSTNSVQTVESAENPYLIQANKYIQPTSVANVQPYNVQPSSTVTYNTAVPNVDATNQPNMYSQTFQTPGGYVQPNDGSSVQFSNLYANNAYQYDQSYYANHSTVPYSTSATYPYQQYQQHIQPSTTDMKVTAVGDAYKQSYIGNEVSSNMYYQYGYQADGTANVYGYVNPAQGSYVNVNYQNVPASSNTVQTTTEPPKTEKSNVDLLSGLDFTINQAPLIPQQKVETPSKTVSVTKTVGQPSVVSSKPTTSKPEEKISTPKEVLRNEKKLMEKLQRDPFQDAEVGKQFIQEVEKFEKFVDVIATKTLNGPTPLELKWKEIQDKQEADQQKKSISVARCCPLKNRFPDILPYDQTRVKLTNCKDDYINASVVRDITPNSPFFILTQSPIPATFSDFWQMIWEQQAELILCLVTDSEIQPDIYWPKDKNSPLTLANMTLSLQTVNVRDHWTDSIIIIHRLEDRITRTVRHLQLTNWTASLFPTYPSITSYIGEILKDQRALIQPIVIHCVAGIGRSGVLAILLATTLEVLINPIQLPDLTSIAIKLTNTRKNALRDREHFRFAYSCLLHFIKEICSNRLKPRKLSEDTAAKSVTPSPATATNASYDPLNALDPLWATKKGGSS